MAKFESFKCNRCDSIWLNATKNYLWNYFATWLCVANHKRLITTKLFNFFRWNVSFNLLFYQCKTRFWKHRMPSYVYYMYGVRFMILWILAGTLRGKAIATNQRIERTILELALCRILNKFIFYIKTVITDRISIMIFVMLSLLTLSSMHMCV